MAITAANLDSNSDSGSGTAYSTGAFTPTAGALMVIAIVSTTNGTTAEAPSSVTGHGVTWTRQIPSGVALPNAVSGSQERAMTVWTATAPASPTSDTVDITFTNSHIGALWSCVEFPGADGVDKVVGGEESGGGSELTLDLGSAPAAGSATYMATGLNDQDDLLADSPAVELADIAMSGPNSQLQTQWDDDGPQTITGSAGVFHGYSGIALEVTEASTGTTETESVAGSITPTGSLTLEVHKSLSGEISFASVDRDVTPGIVLEGTITPSGDLTVEKIVEGNEVSIAGSVTPTGDLTLVVARKFEGTVTPSGVVDHDSFKSKTFAGSITPSGQLTLLTVKTFQGSVAMSGTASLGIVRELTVLLLGDPQVGWQTHGDVKTGWALPEDPRID